MEKKEDMPEAVKVVVDKIKRRVEELRQKHGSLAEYGMPVLQSLEEIAVIYYLYKLGYTRSQIARILGISKDTVRNLVSNIEEKGSVSIMGPKSERITIATSPKELTRLVEEVILRTPAEQIRTRDSVIAEAESALRSAPARLSICLSTCIPLEGDYEELKKRMVEIVRRLYGAFT